MAPAFLEYNVKPAEEPRTKSMIPHVRADCGGAPPPPPLSSIEEAGSAVDEDGPDIFKVMLSIVCFFVAFTECY